MTPPLFEATLGVHQGAIPNFPKWDTWAAKSLVPKYPQIVSLMHSRQHSLEDMLELTFLHLKVKTFWPGL